jgi:alpha-mannosidase
VCQGNYYPVTTGAWLTDGASSFGVLVDRAEGAASLQDGALELMLHRRILWSCFGYNLNETGVDGRGLIITGTHRLFLSAKDDTMTRMRLQQQRSYAPLLPLFSPSSASPQPLPQSTSGIRQPLPPNVELLTLQQLNATTSVVRLSHSFAINESSVWSRTAHVDLTRLFTRQLVSVEEMSLTGNAKRPSSSANLTDITLRPMEVRTFFCNFVLSV